MGFTTGNGATLTLEIDGKEYQGALDSPAFIDFWRNNAERFTHLSDDTNPNMAQDTVTFCANMITALLGVEAAQEIFNGKPVSLIDCVALVGYVMQEIANQGIADKLVAAQSKYGVDTINR